MAYTGLSMMQTVMHATIKNELPYDFTKGILFSFYCSFNYEAYEGYHHIDILARHRYSTRDSESLCVRRRICALKNAWLETPKSDVYDTELKKGYNYVEAVTPFTAIHTDGIHNDIRRVFSQYNEEILGIEANRHFFRIVDMPEKDLKAFDYDPDFRHYSWIVPENDYKKPMDSFEELFEKHAPVVDGKASYLRHINDEDPYIKAQVARLLENERLVEERSGKLLTF